MEKKTMLSLKNAFLVQAILELIGGITLILSPSSFFFNEDTSSSYLAVSKMFGVLATILGITCFQVFKNWAYTELIRMLSLVFMIYHVAIGLQMYAAYSQGITAQLGGVIIHLLMALILLYCYMNERKHFA